MLTIKEIQALAKVAGVEVIADRWHGPRWEAYVSRGHTILLVGALADTKRKAMNNVWGEYVEKADL